jgi:hypothetical protein
LKHAHQRRLPDCDLASFFGLEIEEHKLVQTAEERVRVQSDTLRGGKGSPMSALCRSPLAICSRPIEGSTPRDFGVHPLSEVGVSYRSNKGNKITSLLVEPVGIEMQNHLTIWPTDMARSSTRQRWSVIKVAA